ncbi:NACHT domain-containing protein [Planktothrix agardhii]|nr:NACHT domain-containing NTPase [Planktothrix agardhii]
MGQTKMGLATQLGIARSTVSNLFVGRAIERKIFANICQSLKLDWREIANQPEVEETESDLDALVAEVRQKIRSFIQEKCGTMRVLDMSQPVGLTDIYTDVNILEKITGRRRINYDDLVKQFDPDAENFDRFGLNKITEKRVPGVEAVERFSKLMILGKPGAGKTTFLKYLAIQCIEGNLQADRVPIFITLKDFAEAENEPNLLTYIHQQFANFEITENQIIELLKQGRGFIFLDGLDEVREEDSKRVLNQIKTLTEQYYKNQFLITCRIAAQDYALQTFTEVEVANVEVADFDNKQIENFVTKWFQVKGLDLADKFIEKLNDNPPIRELASSPILLTLLCLEFEDSGDFPTDRAALYQRGTATLLSKWDATRGIERDQVYKQLSLQRKQDLLSEIAWNTFERKQYFFKQKDLEQEISNYIRNLPNAKTDPELLQLDSEAILKSIEAQHGLLIERARGIYSFSHLTFHEYFAARKIVTSCNPYSPDDPFLKKLAQYIISKNWREVFLLTVVMLSNSNYFLLLAKESIDSFVSRDNMIQDFLIHVYNNTALLDLNHYYKPAAIRVLYFSKFTNELFFSLQKELQLKGTFNKMASTNHQLAYKIDKNILDESFTIDSGMLDIYIKFHPYKFSNHLKRNRQIKENKKKLKQLEFNKIYSKTWSVRDELNLFMVKLDSDLEWELEYEKKDILNKYFYANKILVDCLNSDCYVSREVREEIEETLLLPIEEIEKWKQQHRPTNP